MMARKVRLTLVLLVLQLYSYNGCIRAQPRPVIEDAILSLKLKMVERINLDRAEHSLPLLKYDALASKVGDAHCREMLEGSYVSHWDRKGWKPYLRHAQAGGNDFNSENLSVSKYYSSAPGDHINVQEAIFNNHRDMLKERPPNDGHRKNILDPYHTHVGIGLAFDQNRVYMAQEFLNRYVECKPSLPRRVRLRDKITVSGKVLNRSYAVQSISVFYEPLPESMTVEELNATETYALPEERYDLLPRLAPERSYKGGGRGDIVLRGEQFQCVLPFFREVAGVYTVVVWVRDDHGRVIPASEVAILVTEQ